MVGGFGPTIIGTFQRKGEVVAFMAVAAKTEVMSSTRMRSLFTQPPL